MSLIRGTRFLRGLVCVGVACAVSSVAMAQEGDPPAAAPEPSAVVERCVERMGSIAGATVGEIRERSAHGVAAIAMLAQGDAAAMRIIHAGDLTKDACARAAARGQAALDGTLEACVGVLREIGAPEAAFEIVFEARRRGGLAIGNARTGCHRHVNQAVMRALSSGDEGAGVGGRAGVLLVD